MARVVIASEASKRHRHGFDVRMLEILAAIAATGERRRADDSEQTSKRAHGFEPQRRCTQSIKSPAPLLAIFF